MRLSRLPSIRFTHSENQALAKKPNYDFEKRRKEMDRKAKKDAKREDKARRKSGGAAEEPADPLAPAQDLDDAPQADQG